MMFQSSTFTDDVSDVQMMFLYINTDDVYYMNYNFRSISFFSEFNM